MRPIVLFAGLALFGILWGFHVVIWRLFRPVKDFRALCLILFVIPLGLFFLYLFGDLKPFAWAEVSAIFLLYFSFVGAYLQTYHPAFSGSPSLNILIAIAQHMPRGLSEEEILRSIPHQNIVFSRLEGLCSTFFAKEKNGAFFLTLLGRVTIFLVVLYRRLLGLPVKGG